MCSEDQNISRSYGEDGGWMPFGNCSFVWRENDRGRGPEVGRSR